MVAAFAEKNGRKKLNGWRFLINLLIVQEWMLKINVDRCRFFLSTDTLF
jgi:hypothetical protein